MQPSSGGGTRHLPDDAISIFWVTIIFFKNIIIFFLNNIVIFRYAIYISYCINKHHDISPPLLEEKNLASFVMSLVHPGLLLLSVPSIHRHRLTRRTRSSRSTSCSPTGTCPDAACALTTVAWTAAAAPLVWAEPAGAAPGECSVGEARFHLCLSCLFTPLLLSLPFSRLPKSRLSQGLSLSCSESLLRSTPRKPSAQSFHNSSVHSEASDASLLSSLLDESSIKEHTLVDSLWGNSFEFVLSVACTLFFIYLLFEQLEPESLSSRLFLYFNFILVKLLDSAGAAKVD